MSTDPHAAADGLTTRSRCLAVPAATPAASPRPPLRLGNLAISPPVVLAPMAGVTNHPFRTLCRRFGAGLCVSEMITARPLVEGQFKTLKLAEFAPNETPRSLQLYGVDPYYVGEAVARLVGEGHVDHIDMNFGCPVAKVTRKGGGAALPYRHRLLRSIVRAAVRRAGSVPVTIKFRKGIDDAHLTYLTTGRIAEEEGCAAVALHARTAAQLYDGTADWRAIAELKAHVAIPVLGNGDIWEGADAVRMISETGCDGIVVGRGCLGRPWLFEELAHVLDGDSPPPPPTFRQVRAIMIEHAEMLAEFLGERLAMRAFRRHAAWYTKGFRGSAALRATLMQVGTLNELAEVLEHLDPDEPFPATVSRVSRGKTAGTQRVALPHGYLDDPDDPTPPVAAPDGSAPSGG